jgi:hypothetical protein
MSTVLGSMTPSATDLAISGGKTSVGGSGFSSAGSSRNKQTQATDARMANLLDAYRYEISHWWKPLGIGIGHHSQLQVKSMLSGATFNFGLWGNANGEVEICDDGPDLLAAGYTRSTTYAPNPITTSGQTIKAAYLEVTQITNGTYNVAFNNCQKFARGIMVRLGATHMRQPGH